MLWASDEANRVGPIIIGGVAAPVLWVISSVTILYYQLWVSSAPSYYMTAEILITAGLFFGGRAVVRSGLGVTVCLWTPDSDGGACYKRRDRLRDWWDKPAEYWMAVGRSEEIWLYSADGLKDDTDWTKLPAAEFAIGPGRSSADFFKLTQPDEVTTWNKTHHQRTTAAEVVKYGVLLAMFGGFILGAIAME